MVGEEEKLIHGLGDGVVPPALGGRAVEHVVVLAERDLRALAVHLARGGDQNALAVARRRVERRLGADDVRLDRLHRIVDDELHAHRRRQVVDDVHAADRRREGVVGGEVAEDVAEPGLPHASAKVGHAPGGEIVPDDDLFAPRQQVLGEVASDEPGTARDQIAHVNWCDWSAERTMDR